MEARAAKALTVSRIQGNTAALVLSFVSTTVLSFVTIKILTGALTPDEVGMYAGSLAACAVFAAIVDFGLPQVLLRYAARHEARGESARVRGLGLRSLLVAVAIALVLGIFVARAKGWLASLFAGRDLPPDLFPWAFAFAAVGSLKAVTYGAMNGLRRMSIPVAIEQSGFLAATLALFLLRDRLDPLLVFQVNVAAGLLGLVVAVLLLLRVAPAPDSASSAAEGSAGASPAYDGGDGLIAYWAGAFVTILLSVLMDTADRILVGATLPLLALSLFHIAAKVTHFVRRFLYIPIQVTAPEVTRKAETGTPEALARDLEILGKALVAAGLLLASGMALLARPAVLAISTPAFLGAADLLAIFAFVVPVMSVYAPLQSALRSVGKIRPTAYAEALWLGVYLLSASVLLRRFGIAGVPLAQVLASIAVLVYVLSDFRRATGIPLREGIFVRLFLGSVGILAAVTALARWLRIDGLAAGALAGIVLLVAFNVLLVRARYFDDEEIARLRGLVSAPWIQRVIDFALAWPRGRRTAAPREAA